MAELEYVCFKQVQILQTEYLSRTQQELMEKVKWDHFYKGLSLSTGRCWPKRSMVKIMSPIPNFS